MPLRMPGDAVCCDRGGRRGRGGDAGCWRVRVGGACGARAGAAAGEVQRGMEPPAPCSLPVVAGRTFFLCGWPAGERTAPLVLLGPCPCWSGSALDGTGVQRCTLLSEVSGRLAPGTTALCASLMSPPGQQGPLSGLLPAATVFPRRRSPRSAVYPKTGTLRPPVAYVLAYHITLAVTSSPGLSACRGRWRLGWRASGVRSAKGPLERAPLEYAFG